ncbi:MAG: hypothetical protein KDE27_06775 [Planctomycetes bacterium]|nr:hypothetical protein [Planctomycetota bacterium]
MRASARLGFALALTLATAAGAAAQDADDRLDRPLDPYTEGDADLMQAAGIVRYGPFPWADHKTTDDLEVELGKNRFVWLETAHFRIGCSLGAVPWPQQPAQRKFLKDEVEAVRARLAKFPKKPRRFGRWERAHLYAHRLERLYSDVQELLGVTDADFGDAAGPPNGPFLGMGDKYLVLLFQKTSDLARYFEHFCRFETKASMRWHHRETEQILAAIAVESLDGFDSTAVHSHVIYNVAHGLLTGFRGNHVRLPLWLEEGLAHHFALAVPSPVANVLVLDHEAGPDARLNAWPGKVRRRAQHDGGTLTFEQMAAWQDFRELGHHAHAQSWSRVDYLLHEDRAKVAAILKAIKAIPPLPNELIPHERVAAVTKEQLAELFGLDPPGFDAKWRAYVLATYPKK